MRKRESEKSTGGCMYCRSAWTGRQAGVIGTDDDKRIYCVLSI